MASSYLLSPDYIIVRLFYFRMKSWWRLKRVSITPGSRQIYSIKSSANQAPVFVFRTFQLFPFNCLKRVRSGSVERWTPLTLPAFCLMWVFFICSLVIFLLGKKICNLFAFRDFCHYNSSSKWRPRKWFPIWCQLPMKPTSFSMPKRRLPITSLSDWLHSRRTPVSKQEHEFQPHICFIFPICNLQTDYTNCAVLVWTYQRALLFLPSSRCNGPNLKQKIHSVSSNKHTPPCVC